jgi:hypothetical protein
MSNSNIYNKKNMSTIKDRASCFNDEKLSSCFILELLNHMWHHMHDHFLVKKQYILSCDLIFFIERLVSSVQYYSFYVLLFFCRVSHFYSYIFQFCMIEIACLPSWLLYQQCKWHQV